MKSRPAKAETLPVASETDTGLVRRGGLIEPEGDANRRAAGIAFDDRNVRDCHHRKNIARPESGDVRKTSNDLFTFNRRP